MKLKMTAVLVLMAALIGGAPAKAADASLQIHGDLMIHPDQVAEFFAIGGNQIRNSSVWNWQTLSFSLPYKTTWTNVQAHGPFNVQFDTTSLKTQELGFTLSWADPQLNVGTFDIHDVITRDVGGVPVTVQIDGTCTGLQLRIPGGQWNVKGKMHWDFSTGAFTVAWENFALTTNGTAVPQLDLGQCQGLPGLIQTLRETVLKLTTDQAWLQDVLKAGLQDWMQSTLGTLQTQLLTTREVSIKEKMKVAWMPAQLTTLPGGMLRVAGTFVLAKPGSLVGADQLPRNYDPAILGRVTESGFIMPKDTMSRIFRYMQINGELQYRLNSTDVAAFTSLMNSRFLQFFVWPDLMNFNTSTQFYFDLASQTVPVLGDGAMLDGGGSAYNITMPMIVHQWAPDANGKSYVPYIDFTAPVQGKLQAQIKDGVLSLQIHTDDLKIDDSFRLEYQKIRDVNPWVATYLLSSSVKDYLNSTPYYMAVPSWQIGNELSLSMRDIQVYQQTFRIPLQFTQVAP
ncbi:MAG: hypothetical protein ACXVA9_11860 [Bdellovibrionales bacterium]